MSQPNVEIVRRSVEAWNAGDLVTMELFFDPAGVMYAPEGWPEPAPWHGRDEVFAEFRRIRADFGHDQVELDDPVTNGDWVLVMSTRHLRGVRSGLAGQMRVSYATRLRAGRIVEARFYWDHGEALKAVGLED
jgi:ketosteroid isomerase-like protein